MEHEPNAIAINYSKPTLLQPYIYDFLILLHVGDRVQ